MCGPSLIPIRALRAFCSLLVLLVTFIAARPSWAQDFQVAVPEGHASGIESAQFGGDGRYVLTTGKDKTVRLWETSSGHLLRTLRFEKDLYHSDIGQDGKFMLTITDSIKVWDITTGQLLYTLEGMSGKFLRGGKIIGSSVGDSLFLFDPVNGRHVYHPNDYGADLQVSPDGRLACFWNEFDERFGIFDLRAQRFLHHLTAAGGDVEQAGFSPDSKLLFTRSGDRTVTIWNAAAGRAITRIENESDVNGVSFTNDSQHFVIADDEPKLIFRSVRNGRPNRVLDTEAFSIDGVYFTPDDKYIITQGYEATRVWTMADFQPLWSIKPTEAPGVSPDSKLLLTYEYDGASASLWNIAQGELFHFLSRETMPVRFQRNLPDDRLLLSSIDQNAVVRVWDPARGDLKYELDRHDSGLSLESIHAEKNLLLTCSETDHTAKVWDGLTGEVRFTCYDTTTWYDQPSTFWNSAFSPDGNQVLINATKVNDDGDLDVFDTETGTLLYTKRSPGVSSRFLFHPDNRFLHYFVGDTMFLYDTPSGKLIRYFAGHSANVDNAAFNHDYSQIVTGANDGIIIWNVSGKILHRFGGFESHISSVGFSADGTRVIASSGEAIYVWDASTGRSLLKIETGTSLQTARFSPDDKRIASIDADEVLKVWDAGTGKLLHHLANPPLEYSYDLPILFSPDSRYAIINVYSSVRIWDMVTGTLAATAWAPGEDYAVILPSGYYQCSPGAARHLFFRNGTQTLAFEQLDLRYNRPDVVMQFLGDVTGEDNQVIREALAVAYDKRLRKMGIGQAEIEADVSVPTLRFVNEESIAAEQSSGDLKLHIRAVDTLYTLASLNIWINEVPVLGKDGIRLHARAGTIDTLVTVSLSEGQNRIEAAVTNEKGSESFRYPVFVNYTPAAPHTPKLYFVGIGINQYVDSTMNLNYAAKDIRDLAGEFSRRHPVCEIDTLINAMAVRENILSLKEKLRQTHVEDKVIISFSGHGVLDDSLNFYFSTYDLDFQRPSARGLRYEDLEDLLHDIPARKKLLLIDACHSGEVDRETDSANGQTYFHRVEEGGVTSFSPRGAELLTDDNPAGLQNSFELMKEMFANLNRSNGVMVISAAGGREYAFEGRDFSNGVFTYTIKKALLDNEADLDGLNGVTVSELKKYVSREVSRLTMGKQKPTTRKETLLYDWALFQESGGLASDQEATRLFERAERLLKEERVDDAASIYMDVVTRLKGTDNYVNRDYCELCHYLGGYFNDHGNPERALEFFQEEVGARKLLKRRSDEYIDALYALIGASQSLGRSDEAAPLLEELLEVTKIVHKERSLPHAYALNYTGVHLANQNKYAEAIPYYQRSVEILEKVGKSDTRTYSGMHEQFENYATIVANLGYAFRITGDHQHAIGAYERALSTLEAIDKKTSPYALYLNAMAMSYEALGITSPADSLYGESRALLQALGDTLQSDYVYITENLARLKKRSGSWDAADVLYDEIRTALTRIEGHDQAHRVNVLNDHAILNQELGRYEKAKALYLESIALCRQWLGDAHRNCETISRNLERLLEKMSQD